MIETQIQKFNQNWQKNSSLYGTEIWEKEPDFVHYIAGLIPLETTQHLAEIQQAVIQKLDIQNPTIPPLEHLHVTLALPGRLGTHFQKNDVKYIKKTLKDIFAACPSIPLRIQNINMFPNVVFAEVYDPTSRLQQIHETICNEIPFSQHPEYRYQNFLPHVSLIYGGTPNQKIVADFDRHFKVIETEISEIIFGKSKNTESDNYSLFHEKNILEKFTLKLDEKTITHR